MQAFERSAKRFGLELVGLRSFSQSNDSRERNNVALLTGDADYDLIFVAAAAAELGRHMTGVDWAAWAATSIILRAVAATGTLEAEALLAYLKSDRLAFDTYKGAPGSFRSWNNQLRQPILLHTADAVIARAPVEGFLHPTSDLDTLGAVRPESECAALTEQ